MYYWEKEIEALAAELEAKGGKLQSCFGNKKSAIYHELAALRVAGLAEGASTFECNYCGEEFPVSSAMPAVRGGVPVIVDSGCLIAGKLKRL